MKKYIIIAVILLVIAAGVFLAYESQSSNKGVSDELIPTPTVALPTISDDIKVGVTFGQNNQSIALKIIGLSSDLESIEYELTYITGGGLPRGVLGKITLKGGEKEVKRDDIVLGTCSSGKCVYDTGVQSVDLSLKFNTASGSKVFQKTYSL